MGEKGDATAGCNGKQFGPKGVWVGLVAGVGL